MKTIEKILEFFGLTTEIFSAQDPQLIAKMIILASQDKFFELHQLGYKLQREN